MQQYGGGAADPFRSLSGLPNASPMAQAPAGQQQPLADGGVARSSAVEAPSENGRDIMKLQASLVRAHTTCLRSGCILAAPLCAAACLYARAAPRGGRVRAPHGVGKQRRFLEAQPGRR